MHNARNYSSPLRFMPVHAFHIAANEITALFASREALPFLVPALNAAPLPEVTATALPGFDTEALLPKLTLTMNVNGKYACEVTSHFISGPNSGLINLEYEHAKIWDGENSLNREVIRRLVFAVQQVGFGYMLTKALLEPKSVPLFKAAGFEMVYATPIMVVDAINECGKVGRGIKNCSRPADYNPLGCIDFTNAQQIKSVAKKLDLPSGIGCG